MQPAAFIMPAAGVLLCLLALIPGRRNPLACFARALGMQALIALPVGLAQALWLMRGADFPDLLLAPLAGVPFNVGGLLSAAAFESIDRAGLLAHRQSTVIDNLGVYSLLVALQAGAVAIAIAARTRATGRILADKTILTLLALVLANSVLGITWPWWGT